MRDPKAHLPHRVKRPSSVAKCETFDAEFPARASFAAILVLHHTCNYRGGPKDFRYRGPHSAGIHVMHELSGAGGNRISAFSSMTRRDIKHLQPANGPECLIFFLPTPTASQVAARPRPLAGGRPLGGSPGSIGGLPEFRHTIAPSGFRRCHRGRTGACMPSAAPARSHVTRRSLRAYQTELRSRLCRSRVPRAPALAPS